MTVKKIADNLYTDGCGCYDSKCNCFCAECFYYGRESNCSYILSEEDYSKLESFIWDENKGFIKYSGGNV